MALRLLTVMAIFALRLLAQPAALPSTFDTPPPPVEDRVAAAGDDADAPADDPSDLDDDDDSSDDVVLPARIVPAAPPAVVVRPTWSLRSLADKDTREPLFRPPRSV